MTKAQFQTLRHMETVRNHINFCVKELLGRAEHHDQSKLQSPEAEIFEEYTPKLRDLTYGSDEYKDCLVKMGGALDHHYANNQHHPEHFPNGMEDMNLIDILEMVCDWYSATKRHNDGNILISIEKNQEKYGFSNDFKKVLINTARMLDDNQKNILHFAHES